MAKPCSNTRGGPEPLSMGTSRLSKAANVRWPDAGAVSLDFALGTDDSCLEGVDDVLDTVTEAEFAKDSSDMRLHGGLRYEQPVSDLGVGQAVGHRHQYLP